MGSSESKLKSNDSGTRVQINSVPCTPIKCSDRNCEDISHLDPRSPSDEIFRTPLEVSFKIFRSFEMAIKSMHVT